MELFSSVADIQIIIIAVGNKIFKDLSKEFHHLMRFSRQSRYKKLIAEQNKQSGCMNYCYFQYYSSLKLQLSYQKENIRASHGQHRANKIFSGFLVE